MRLGRHYEFMLFKFRTKPIDIKKSTTDGNGRSYRSVTATAATSAGTHSAMEMRVASPNCHRLGDVRVMAVP